jgi:hypothetical protein
MNFKAWPYGRGLTETRHVSRRTISRRKKEGGLTPGGSGRAARLILRQRSTCGPAT